MIHGWCFCFKMKTLQMKCQSCTLASGVLFGNCMGHWLWACLRACICAVDCVCVPTNTNLPSLHVCVRWFIRNFLSSVSVSAAISIVFQMVWKWWHLLKNSHIPIDSHVLIIIWTNLEKFFYIFFFSNNNGIVRFQCKINLNVNLNTNKCCF